MHTYRLQNWITLTGDGNSPAVVPQTDDGWLNLEAYRDLQFWIDVSDLDNSNGAITLTFQHAPLRDETMFYPSISATSIASTGLTVRSAMFDYACSSAGLPLSKWLRWMITGPNGNWAITFRIFVSAGGAGSGMVPERLLHRLAD